MEMITFVHKTILDQIKNKIVQSLLWIDDDDDDYNDYNDFIHYADAD